MRTIEFEWHPDRGLSWTGEAEFQPDLVLFFGARAALERSDCFSALRAAFPLARIVGCSTGGQFHSGAITDESVIAVAVKFHHAKIDLATIDGDKFSDSEECGRVLGEALSRPDLKAILVISDGLKVNGSKLVAGLTQSAGQDVIISGGMAGDGTLFENTIVAANAHGRSGAIAAIGFFGSDFEIRTGSAGGWDPFGPRRRITKSSGNVLFELDGQSALELYERYLGEEESRELPGSGLLFPLRIDDPNAPGNDVVRTILAIDRERGSITFAGDMPEGWTAQLMHGNFDRLIDGAADAARQSASSNNEVSGLSVLISCIGRRLLMGQRAGDEIDAAADELARNHGMIGFYSYGEISPHSGSGFCQLHNQTMTVFSVYEREVRIS
ncbi:MAG: FIST signal transduction protein [Rhabdaerophilum sp.]